MDKFDYKNEYAPVAVSVYHRLEHFKNCIESLRSNSIAKHTELYVFSDAARKGDENKIQAIRSFVDSITGFRRVHKIYQKKNDYPSNKKNFREYAYQDHDRLILLEDDVVVREDFLEYMNKGLDFYKDDPGVFCICGYVSKVNADPDGKYTKAFSCLNGSGVGFWRDKFFAMMADYNEVHPFTRLSGSWRLLRSYLSIAGFRGYYNLYYMKKNNLFQGDRLFIEYMIRHSKVAVFPPQTLTVNKGFDGTGVHALIDMLSQGEAFGEHRNDVRFRPSYDTREIRRETKKYLGRLTSVGIEIRAILKLCLSLVGLMRRGAGGRRCD